MKLAFWKCPRCQRIYIMEDPLTGMSYCYAHPSKFRLIKPQYRCIGYTLRVDP